jgi:hypothetical protein
MKHEKTYKYMICLLTDSCYGDFVEGGLIDGDGMPVGNDITYAKYFDNTDKAHKFAKENGIQLGDYSIHGYYV